MCVWPHYHVMYRLYLCVCVYTATSCTNASQTLASWYRKAIQSWDRTAIQGVRIHTCTSTYFPTFSSTSAPTQQLVKSLECSLNIRWSSPISSTWTYALDFNYYGLLSCYLFGSFSRSIQIDLLFGQLKLSMYWIFFKHTISILIYSPSFRMNYNSWVDERPVIDRWKSIV